MIKTVDSINVLEESVEYDVLTVNFADGLNALIFGKKEDFVEFIGQEVIVEFRTELYHSELRQVVVSFTKPSHVATIQKMSNKRLYTEDVDNLSNICFRDMVEHEKYTGVVLYCVSHSYNSSAKATWAEYKVRDQLFHVKTLRVFDYDNRDADFTGRYITCDCTYDKYGLSSTRVTPLELAYLVNPEIAMAERYLSEYLLGDKELAEICASYDLIHSMADYVDVERGYLLVKAAYAIDICREMANLLSPSDVDLRTVERALLLQYLYTTRTASTYSNQVSNIVLLLQKRISERADIIQCLDVEDKGSAERKVFQQVNSLVENLVNIRKGEQ